ncbi:MAG: Isoprenyl transferase [Candidatus Omnitrophica bacterium]|nr:Isoprenyl transferase [Candidatus Omnitrophota bacterium]
MSLSSDAAKDTANRARSDAPDLPQRLPQHVAVIMDGNGRWATERGLPRVAGHQAGVQTVREIVRASLDAGVPVLTLYAFSQENWKRPKDEVGVLMDLLDHFIVRELDDLERQGVRLRTIGRTEALPPRTLEKIRDAEKRTSTNAKLTLVIALNYGARTEILDAVRQLMRRAAADPGSAERALDEAVFSEHLYTKGLPDPDLLIRTSGEMRLSNFLLWQMSYTEIYITRKYWPDFTREDYFEALREYATRERRFGDVSA